MQAPACTCVLVHACMLVDTPPGASAWLQVVLDNVSHRQCLPTRIACTVRLPEVCMVHTHHIVYMRQFLRYPPPVPKGKKANYSRPAHPYERVWEIGPSGLSQPSSQIPVSLHIGRYWHMYGNTLQCTRQVQHANCETVCMGVRSKEASHRSDPRRGKARSSLQ